MITPAVLPIVGNRWTPLVYAIQINDIDLSAAIFDMHVRLLPDTPGTPLIDLSPAAAGVQGISATYDGSSTTITIQIDEATMEALPDASAVGNDLTLYWDMHITPSGGIKQVYFRGTFTVRPGATQ